MATVREFVTWALQRTGIVSLGVSPDAAEMADGVSVFNQMIAQWAIDGRDLELDELAENDDVETETAYLSAIRLSLAEELAEGYGVPVSAKLAADAERARGIVTAALFTIEQLEPDDGVPVKTLANRDA